MKQTQAQEARLFSSLSASQVSCPSQEGRGHLRKLDDEILSMKQEQTHKPRDCDLWLPRVGVGGRTGDLGVGQRQNPCRMGKQQGLAAEPMDVFSILRKP